MFLPHDGSAAAFSWRLHGWSAIEVRLAIRLLFSGCGPRSYRDTGFRLQSEDGGSRLTWLPSVLGPAIVADTNGCYRDEPARVTNDILRFSGDENLVAPGTFEFVLGERPSVLIFINEDHETESSHMVGTFLAGLMPEGDRPATISPRMNIECDACLVQAA